MNLIQWKPFRELNSFFDDGVTDTFPMFHADLAVDLYQENEHVVAEMSLPGVEESEIDISIENDLLTVSGQREEEEVTKEKDYYRKEIKRGSFSRTVRLPKSVQAERAVAHYANGVLKISVPVTAGAKDTAIKVQISK